MNLNQLSAAFIDSASSSARKAAAGGKGLLDRAKGLYRGAEKLTAPADEMKKAPIVDRLAERMGFWAIPGYGLYALGKSHGAGGQDYYYPPSNPPLY